LPCVRLSFGNRRDEARRQPGRADPTLLLRRLCRCPLPLSRAEALHCVSKRVHGFLNLRIVIHLFRFFHVAFEITGAGVIADPVLRALPGPRLLASNVPPAKPGAFCCEPLKAAMRGRWRGPVLMLAT
jgi:hypothetical protein